MQQGCGGKRQDYRCAMARFDIPGKTKKKARHNEETPEKTEENIKMKIWLNKCAKMDSKHDTRTSNKKSKMQNQ